MRMDAASRRRSSPSGPAALAILACAALLAPAAGAQEPDPRLYARPAPDATPTAFACTVETLLSDQPCFFESLAAHSSKPQEQARENARRAAGLADDACARAARPRGTPQPDAAVLSVCKKEFVSAAMVCGDNGESPLLDAEDRFSEAAKPCYRLMVNALSRVRLMAAATAGCCQCLARTSCGKAPEQCNRNLARGAVAFAEPCLDRCAEECRSFVAEGGPEGPAAARATRRPARADDDSSHIHTPGVRPRPDDEDDHVHTPRDGVVVIPSKRPVP